MNQYLIAFCYLFTIILLFLAFFICRAVPAGQPINIDLYQNNTIISFSISNPSQITYTVPEEQHKAINNNWGNQEAWGNEDGWNHADDWNKQETRRQLYTAEWIDWVFDHININQIERSQDTSLSKTSKTSLKKQMDSSSTLIPHIQVFRNSKTQPLKNNNKTSGR